MAGTILTNINVYWKKNNSSGKYVKQGTDNSDILITCHESWVEVYNIVLQNIFQLSMTLNAIQQWKHVLYENYVSQYLLLTLT